MSRLACPPARACIATTMSDAPWSSPLPSVSVRGGRGRALLPTNRPASAPCTLPLGVGRGSPFTVAVRLEISAPLLRDVALDRRLPAVRSGTTPPLQLRMSSGTSTRSRCWSGPPDAPRPTVVVADQPPQPHAGCPRRRLWRGWFRRVSTPTACSTRTKTTCRSILLLPFLIILWLPVVQLRLLLGPDKVAANLKWFFNKCITEYPSQKMH